MDYKIVIPSKDRVKDFNNMTYEKIIIKYGLNLKNVYVEDLFFVHLPIHDF